jgi:TPR repeat protein
MYDNGAGVSQDPQEAVRWVQKAAAIGHADAQCALGFLFQQGEGISQDLEESVRWTQKAARQGNVIA